MEAVVDEGAKDSSTMMVEAGSVTKVVDGLEEVVLLELLMISAAVAAEKRKARINIFCNCHLENEEQRDEDMTNTS